MQHRHVFAGPSEAAPVPYVGVLHFENKRSLLSNLIFVEVDHSCPLSVLCAISECEGGHRK